MAEDDDGGAGRSGRPRLIDEDLRGAIFRDCDLRGAKLTDCWLVDVKLSGLVGNLLVNDVDVTAFVEAELDRRHPERIQLRRVNTAADFRAMWATIERLWSETVDQARRPPAPGYPEEPRTVGRCLRVVMREECEHRRYAVRDLTLLGRPT